MKDQRIFWDWFRANEYKYRNVEVPEKEQLLDEILGALHTYSPDLWFETGTADDGVQELIISAEGNPDYFSKVRTLIAAAPPVTNWRFIAFKPAMGFEFNTDYEGITFSPDSTWFLPLRVGSDPTALGIRIAYSHFDESRRGDFLAGTYIMLECALGELALAERIQQIEVTFLPSSPETSGYYPVTELQNYLDRRVGSDS